MFNGIHIVTGNGPKEFFVKTQFNADDGALRFELRDLETIYFRLSGQDGEGFKIDDLSFSYAGKPKFDSNSDLNVFIHANSICLVSKDCSKTYRLSEGCPQNRQQLAELPKFLHRALGDNVAINGLVN